MLVAVITGPSLQEIKKQCAAASRYAQVLEFRLDQFHVKALDQLQTVQTKIPLLFTFRKFEQGGARKIPEKQRFFLIEKLLALKPKYCDLEADTQKSFLKRIKEKYPKVIFIGSFHDFEKMPELEKTLAKMQHPTFTHYKIAAAPRSTLDALELLVFSKERPYVSCIAMGELGQPARIMAPAVGNLLNYASIDEEKASVGQLSLKTLVDLYRFPKINVITKIYALIGDPVEKSPGHLYHNKIFKQKRRNALYVKLRLEKKELPECFELISQLPFAGLSVTVPLKEALIPYLSQIDPVAREIGAVNTIAIHNKMVFGSNTDAPGALNAVEKKLKVRGKKVVILGAGGAARAIAYEAIKRGAEVTILNRTSSRALAVARHLKCHSGALEDLRNIPYQILINTIPLIPGQLPIKKAQLRAKTLVHDIVYAPKLTPLLKAAQEKQCRIVFGEEMFVEQARLQQKLWSKARPS